MKKQLTCIECPRGCNITVTINDNRIQSIEGNLCPKGKIYAENEMTAPKRIITSTIRLTSGEMLSVKTDKAVLKEQIFNIMNIINTKTASKPIKIGQILIKNIGGSGANLIATKNISR